MCVPCQIDPSAACSVTSAQIEQCYNRNQRGVMEFYTAKYTYRLDFSGKVMLKGIIQTTFNPLISKVSNIDSKMFAPINPCGYFSLTKFLHSHAADKCNNREAAANQTLPPLRNRLQVRFGDVP